MLLGAGIKGDMGVVGQTGEKGLRGDPGNNAEKGSKGEPGKFNNTDRIIIVSVHYCIA